MKKLEIGDRVAYSVQFLESIGASHSDMASGRGTVTGLVPLGSRTTLAEIDWNGQELPLKVNVANLAKVGLNTKFSKC